MFAGIFGKMAAKSAIELWEAELVDCFQHDLEMSVLTRATWHNIPEDGILLTRRNSMF
jgi:hypothetical protein